MFDLLRAVADPAIYGWKAHYISRVAEAGLNVPHALALAPTEDITGVTFDPEVSYAVRSSGLGEDSTNDSYAGHFRTYLEVRGDAAVHRAVNDVRKSAGGQMPMGVVIQRMVEEPVISGVAFSLNPVTLDPTVMTISWVQGLGDVLVSGEMPGSDLRVGKSDGIITGAEWPLDTRLMTDLIASVRRFEELLQQPVDVEWAITDRYELAILQLRPVVLPRSEVVDLDGSAAFEGLPGPLRTHSKLSLRATAATLGVPMSPGRIVLANVQAGLPVIRPFIATSQSAGRSVVLLHPTHVDGRVIREFTMDCSTDVEFFVRGCQRYAIRQYPEQSGALKAVHDMLKVGLENGPFACVIEQEILHAYATGVLRQMDDGYLIELALGHFVPKGYVETSTFALSKELKLTYESLVSQSKAYHFINGHVVVETPPYERLAITERELALAVQTLSPILKSRSGVALEFGFTDSPGALQPYMIDVADADEAEAAPTAADIERGVVSAGVAVGHVVDLRATTAQDNLNAHLYDKVLGGQEASLTPAIYIAKTASVDLLPIVRAAHPSSGFVFERASLLAHLPVVLREKGLAGVTLPQEFIEELLASRRPLRIDTANAVTVSLSEGAVQI
jgi:hypothetical protein